MSEILHRNFVAINRLGQSFTVLDIAQLIGDYGPRRFFETFGLTHGHIKATQERVPMTGKISSEARFFPYYYKEVLVPEFEFVLEDGFGRRYSPDYLFDLFCEANPDLADAWRNYDPMWRYKKSGTVRYRRWCGRTKYVKDSPYRRVAKDDEWLVSHGVKGVRKTREYFNEPYEEYYRDPQRSWKSHRKTQYKP